MLFSGVVIHPRDQEAAKPQWLLTERGHRSNQRGIFKKQSQSKGVLDNMAVETTKSKQQHNKGIKFCNTKCLKGQQPTFLPTFSLKSQMEEGLQTDLIWNCSPLLWQWTYGLHVYRISTMVWQLSRQLSYFNVPHQSSGSFDNSFKFVIWEVLSFTSFAQSETDLETIWLEILLGKAEGKQNPRRISD